MAHGGKRPGSGRKRGSVTKVTTEEAQRFATDGEVTPLEVMVRAMRWHYEKKRYDRAAAIAKDAAPYMHARLASVEVSGPDGNPIPFKLYGQDPRCMWTPPTNPACTAPTNGAAPPHN
jgi:hypothetical protein